MLTSLRGLITKPLGQPLKQFTASVHFVLMPEYPDDTDQTNTVLAAVANHDLPPHQSMKDTDCFFATAKSALEFEYWFDEKHMTAIRAMNSTNNQKTFDSVLLPVDSSLQEVKYSFGITKQHFLGSCMHDPNYKRYNEINRMQSRITGVYYEDPEFYLAIKELHANVSLLDDWQRRFVEKVLILCKISGTDATDNEFEIFRNGATLCMTYQSKFRTNLLISYREHFTEQAYNMTDMNLAPTRVLRSLAEDGQYFREGPWACPADTNRRMLFMKYCSNHTTRRKAHQEFHVLASVAKHLYYNNAEVIQDMRMWREIQANAIGFDNYFDVLLMSKMAENRANVENFINALHARAHAKMAKEFEKLAIFAKDKFKIDRIMPWDIDFVINRHAMETTCYNEDSLMPYFPFETVWLNMCNYFGNLFGFSVKDITDAHQDNIWHESVKLYAVHDETDDIVGYLYLDPYKRDDKYPFNYVDKTRDKCSSLNDLPIMNIYMSLSTDEKTGRCLMVLDDVKQLMEKFFETLPALLTESPYAFTAGITNTDIDAARWPMYLGQQFFYRPQLICELSGHLENGEKLPLVEAQNAVDYYRHLISFDLLRELFISEYDMMMFSTNYNKVNFLDVVPGLYKKYFDTILHYQRKDLIPNQLTEVFADKSQGSYYSYKWSEMIACDIMSSFENAGFENEEKVKAVAARLRSTFLSKSSGMSAKKLCRTFLGRDPSIDAICEHYGI